MDRVGSDELRQLRDKDYPPGGLYAAQDLLQEMRVALDRAANTIDEMDKDIAILETQIESLRADFEEERHG